MWGKDEGTPDRLAGGGITPTHVGKRGATVEAEALTRDHPHPCGEKISTSLTGLRSVGSPPPMWGKASDIINVDDWDRITPTHVGKSRAFPAEELVDQDHPHPCGEK